MYTSSQFDASPAPVVVARLGGRVYRFKAHRLGVGTQTGQVVGSEIESLAPAAGPAAPVVAAVGELVKLFSEFFGGGCGSACTQSATLEQVPEVALDDLHAVAVQQPGAISAGSFESAWQGIINYGTAQLQALQAKGDAKAASGITNLNKSTDYSSFVATLPATATVALDLNAAQSVFVSPSAAGYEPGSVAAGNALALQVLQSLAGSSTAASSGLSSLVSSTGLPEWALLAAGAGVVWYLMRG